MERLTLEIPGMEQTYEIRSLCLLQHHASKWDHDWWCSGKNSVCLWVNLILNASIPKSVPHTWKFLDENTFFVLVYYQDESLIPTCVRFSWSSDLVYLFFPLSTTLRNGKAVWGKAKQPTPQWRLCTGRINIRPEEDSPISSYPLVNCAKETSKFYSVEQNQGLIHHSLHSEWFKYRGLSGELALGVHGQVPGSNMNESSLKNMLIKS